MPMPSTYSRRSCGCVRDMLRVATKAAYPSSADLAAELPKFDDVAPRACVDAG